MAELKLKILLDAVERISAPFKRSREATDHLKVSLKEATDKVRQLEQTAGRMSGFAKVKKEAQENARALAEASARTTALGKALAEATVKVDQTKTALGAAQGQVRTTAAAVAEARAKVTALTRAMAEATGEAQQEKEALAKARAELEAKAKAADEAKAKVKTLNAELKEVGKAKTAFESARKESERLREVQVALTRQTATLRDKLKEAGVDTKTLANSQRQLKHDMDAARSAITRESAALDAAKAKMEALAKARARLDATGQTQGRLAGAGGTALGLGAAGIAAGKPVVGDAGDMQHQLAAYGLTAGQSGAALEEVRQALKQTAVEVNQSAEDLLAGQSILVGKGMEPDKALAAIKTIGTAVTGTGAEMADMSNLAFAVMDNLKIPQAELMTAFNVMAKAGDLGGFELKDMASTFPQLTAAAHMLGMSGTKAIASMAAALQVAVKGASDPSEAANNFANFFQKITGPETVKKMEKAGVDLKAGLQKGIKEGKDPIEVAMAAVGKAAGIDINKEMKAAMDAGLDRKAAAERVAQKFAVGEIFGDMQVQNFLAPMIANMGEFRRIRAEALNSDGVVDNKFSTMMETFNEHVKGLGIDWKNTSETIGATVLPTLTELTDKLRAGMQWAGAFAKEHPKLTSAVVLTAGAFAVLAAIGGTITLTLAGILGPFAMIRFGLTALGIKGLGAAGGLRLLSGAFRMLGSVGGTVFAVLTAGLRAVGLAFMANPIGLTIAAIAAAAALIYVYWEPIKSFFAGVFQWIGQHVRIPLAAFGVFGMAAAVIISYWEPIKAFFVGLWDSFGPAVSGAVGQMIANLAPIGQAFAQLWDSLWTPVKSFAGEIGAAVSAGLDGMVARFDPVTRAFSQMWDGIKSAFFAVWDVVKGPLELFLGAKSLFGDAAPAAAAVSTALPIAAPPVTNDNRPLVAQAPANTNAVPGEVAGGRASVGRLFQSSVAASPPAAAPPTGAAPQISVVINGSGLSPDQIGAMVSEKVRAEMARAEAKAGRDARSRLSD